MLNPISKLPSRWPKMKKLNVMINKIVMTDKKPIILKNLFKNLSMFNLLFK